jgi:hypothetical protein
MILLCRSLPQLAPVPGLAFAAQGNMPLPGRAGANRPGGIRRGPDPGRGRATRSEMTEMITTRVLIPPLGAATGPGLLLALTPQPGRAA